MSKQNSKAAKPYSLSELANHYGVTRHTMRKWLVPHRQEIGETVGRFYTVRQVKSIFTALGLPPALDGLDD
jgi:transposase-like protein